MIRKVGTKGQVVIEKPIRDELGIEPGFLAVQRIVGDHLEIRFFPPGHRRSLRGVLRRKKRARVSPRHWDAARSEAWRRAALVAEGEDPDG